MGRKAELLRFSPFLSPSLLMTSTLVISDYCQNSVFISPIYQSVGHSVYDNEWVSLGDVSLRGAVFIVLFLIILCGECTDCLSVCLTILSGVRSGWRRQTGPGEDLQWVRPSLSSGQF